MRHFLLLIIVAIMALASSCGQQSHGRRHLSAADSLRRARAIAEESYLNRMEKLHEQLTGPVPAEGAGVMAPGGAVQVPRPGDTVAMLVHAHERWHKRLERALTDSTTALGALITRVLVQDSAHRYTTATYATDGRLLIYHSEYTPDEHERTEVDLCFDQGRLVHVHERHVYPGDMQDDDQAPDTYKDDAFYLSDGRVVYQYRNEGEVAHHLDHIEYMSEHRYALKGEIAAHLSRVYEAFVADYSALQQQSMEMMVYTAAPREVVHTDGQ